jgi:hypothetical protein
MTRRDVVTCPALAWPQPVSRFGPSNRKPCRNGGPCCAGQFERHGTDRLLLDDCRPAPYRSTGGHVGDAEPNEIASSQFAVVSEAEHGEVAEASLDLQPSPECPDVLSLRGGFAPIMRPAFQGRCFISKFADMANSFWIAASALNLG